MAAAPEDKILTLNNGHSIPLLGFGTWRIGSEHTKQAVMDAIEAGYRHIDCAYVYENEAEVGEGIKNKISDGTVTREELFITGKLWCAFHSKDKVLSCVKKTMSDLSVKYLDMYLIHAPWGLKEDTGELFPVDSKGNVLFSDVDFVDTWQKMEKLVELKLVRSIGVSNFNKSQIERILNRCTIVPATNQIECHPYLLQNEMIAYCRSKGISVTAYAALGSPGFTSTADEPLLLENPKVVQIATKYSITPAQVLLKFQVQRGVICIVKSENKDRIRSNIQIWNFNLTDEDLEILNNIGHSVRYFKYLRMANSPYYPFDEKF